MLIGILSDSHIESIHIGLKGYHSLIEKIENLFDDVDHIIHAGDICSEEFLKDLEKIAPITYCRGNCDLNSNWPRKQLITLNKIRIGITHFPEDLIHFEKDNIRVFIHGHTHYPVIKEINPGILVICPGSLLEPRSPPTRFAFLNQPNSISRPSIAFLSLEENQVSAYIKKL